MLKTVLLLIIFHLIGWFLLTFKITEVPPGINGDEASIGFNAALVAKNGYDQSKRFLPLFVSTPEQTDWKQPITFYSTVFAFKLFSPSYALLRQISVVIILISSFLLFFLSKEIFGSRLAFFSLFIFITIPSVLIQSHLALENIAPIPFILVWLLMLAKYKKYLKKKYLIISALASGISIFSYTALRIIFPVFFLLSIWYIFKLNKRLNNVLIFSLFALIFPLILLSVKSQYPGALLQNNRLLSVPSYQQMIFPFISSFDPSFLFIKGDSTPYHSTGKQGVFLLATLPLIILGIIRIIKRGDNFSTFVLITFFLTPVLYGFPQSTHRGSRLLVLLPIYAVIATYGFLTILNLKNKTKRYIFAILAVLLILLNYYDFVKDYWYEYPQRVRAEFARPYHLIFDKAAKLSVDKKLPVFLQSNFGMENTIAIDFFRESYFKGNLGIWEGKVLPKRSIVIVSDYILPEYKDYPQERVEEFGLIINQ